MKCRPKNRLSELDKIKNKQHRNDGTLEMTKKIRTDVSIKKDDTLDKKERSELRHNSERIEIKIITFNTHETRETIIYKRLPRRSIS